MLEFTGAVLEAVQGLLLGLDDQISQPGVQAFLGPEFSTDGALKRKVRHTLGRLQRRGVLERSGRGVFIRGPLWGRPGVLGSGLEMDREIRRLLNDRGGIVRLSEFLDALGVTDDGTGERAVRRALERGMERGDFVQATPFRLWTKAWMFRRDERQRLPLPGDRIWIDTLMELGSVGIIDAVNQRRLEIGEAVEIARMEAGLAVADVLEGEVGVALASCMEGPDVPHHIVGGMQTLAEWWRGLGDDRGALAWANLESGPPIGDAAVVAALDARFWRILADRLQVDPAALSRGRLR